MINFPKFPAKWKTGRFQYKASHRDKDQGFYTGRNYVNFKQPSDNAVKLITKLDREQRQRRVVKLKFRARLTAALREGSQHSGILIFGIFKQIAN